MPKKTVKLSRREANYQSLKEWVEKKKIPRKFMFDITALLTLYQTGNIHNMNTVKNDITRLISVQKPETFLTNKLTNYINQEPVAVRIRKKRIEKLTNKTAIVNFLLFKPVSDDYDFKASKERRYKRSDGSLWAQIGGIHQITIPVKEWDIPKTIQVIKQICNCSNGSVSSRNELF